jgi:tetratricopeptide (TPR) repeat protein
LFPPRRRSQLERGGDERPGIEDNAARAAWLRALSREVGDRQGQAIALVNLGMTWHAPGDGLRARAALDRSLALCRDIGARYPEGYGLLGLARLAGEEAAAAGALRLAEESLALRREIGHGDGVADLLLEIGESQRRAGDATAARTALEEGLSLSREQGRAPEVEFALAVLACLAGGDTRAAEAALAEAGDTGDSPRVRWLLWQATGDRAHLEKAKRLLDEALAKVPAEHHEAMLTNLRVNREISAAAREHLPPS